MTSAAKRILTALVGAPIVVAIAYIGGWPFVVLGVVVAVVSQSELYRLGGLTPGSPMYVTGLVAGAAVVATAGYPAAWPIALITATLLVLHAVTPRGRIGAIQNLTVALGGLVYPTLLLATIVALRTGTNAAAGYDAPLVLTLTTIGLVWITDTCAYFVGKGIGKHPLTTISPKKTIEGTIGGAVAAALAAVALKLFVVSGLSWLDVAVVAATTGLLSQVGDIAESSLKRSAAVKDSGGLLPGHGGLLDRLDALIVAAPVVYVYAAYLAELVR